MLREEQPFALVPYGGSCSYISPVDGWKCEESAWNKSRYGFCIGHDPNANKSPKTFLVSIQKKFRNRDYNFDGFVFPYSLTIKNIHTEKTISFQACRFLQGVRFENCHFTGPLISFENCAFCGSLLYFQNCQFDGARVSFAHSVFDGELLAFHRCRFEGESADFANIQWRANRRITFVNCLFGGQNCLFDSARMEAPLIAWRGGAVGAELFRISNCDIVSDLFSLSDIHQTRGTLSFEQSRLNCKQIDFTQTDWKGGGVRFHHCRWKGDDFFLGTGNQFSGSLEVKQCHFEGNRIDFSGLNGVVGDIRFTHNRFAGKELIDFSSIISNGNLIVHKCSLAANRVLFERIRVSGDQVDFRNNRVEAHLLSFRESQFLVRRCSWNRSVLHALAIDFSSCLFQNAQTSFQALDLQGQVVSFDQSQFASKRVSFHRSRLRLNRFSLEGVNFGKGTVSFWKTDLDLKEFSLRMAFDEGARIYFACDLSNAFFEGSHLTNCEFRDAAWKSLGWMKRPCLADESAMIDARRFRDLIKLYEWIAEQHAHAGNYRMQDDFLYSSREIQRLDRRRFGSPLENMKWELSRWTNGYGLGLSRGVLLKGLTSLLASISLSIALRLR